MTDRDPSSSYSTRPARDEVEPGIPATDEMPRPIPPGSEDEETPVPLDHPQGVDEWGTTSREEMLDEPLELRVLREEPDQLAGESPSGLSLSEPGTDDAVEDGGGFDDEADAVADLVIDDDVTLAPEEQAMRIDEDPPGLNYDPTPGYLDGTEER